MVDGWAVGVMFFCIILLLFIDESDLLASQAGYDAKVNLIF